MYNIGEKDGKCIGKIILFDGNIKYFTNQAHYISMHLITKFNL